MRPYFGHIFSQASAYYRQIAFADKMLKNKHIASYRHNEYNPEKFNFEVNKFERSLMDLEKRNEFAKYIKYAIETGENDVFIFQLFQTTWGLALMDYIQYLGAAVILDVDDDVFSVNRDNAAAASFFGADSKKLSIVKNALENADGLIISTKHLKKRLKPYSYQDRMFVVENAVDFDIYDKLKNNTHKTYLHIGWQGGSSHNTDMSILNDVVKPVHDKYKNVRFTFSGDPGPELSGHLKGLERVKLDRTWVPVDKFPQRMAKLGFDIQLAPLADNLFNRSKSNLRLIQAGALHTPCVASPVEPYKSFPAKFAKTTEDWVEALSELIEDKELRENLGSEAYEYTKSNFCLDKQAAKYHRTLKRIIKKYNQRRNK